MKVLSILLFAVIFLFLAFPGMRNIIAGKRKASYSNTEKVIIPDSLIQSGDLIFRDGRGIVSGFFKKFSLTDPSYSHAGILHRQGNVVFVFHLVEGVSGGDNHMRKDSLRNFCSNLQSNTFAIYRTTLPGTVIDSIAEQYYHAGIEFDNRFDMTTDDKMYCTEFLHKVLTRVSGNDNFIPLTEFSGKKYSACDNLYLIPGIKKIFYHHYSIR